MPKSKPKPNPPFDEFSATGDDFEDFAKRFLEAKGLKTFTTVSRGSDGGKDIIMKERFTTALETEIDYTWLVSCKYRSGGAAVRATDEQMVIERLQMHQCNGFIGFYATRPSSGLLTYIDGLRATRVAQIHMFDKIIINGSDILSTMNGDPIIFGSIVKTFMPKYYAANFKPTGTGKF